MPWELEERVLLNKFRGRIISSLWEQGDYGPQMVFLISVVSVEDPPDVSWPETKAWYSVGAKGWTISDAGLVLLPEKESQKFHRSSKYGQLIDRAVSDLGLVWITQRGDAESASVWAGLEFDWERQTIEITGIKRGDEEARDIETSVLLPTAYISGAEDVAGATAAAPSSAATPTLTPVSGEELPEGYKDLASLAMGLTPESLKKAVVQEQSIRSNSVLLNHFYNKGLIARLVSKGIIKVEEGIYVPGPNFPA